MRLSGHGLTAELPAGWEGAIVVQRGLEPALPGRVPATAPALASLPALHLATFGLPPGRGDFGSGAVERMGSADAFVALVEYGPESVGTNLFAPAPALPRLRPSDLGPRALQRTIPGQAGAQWFLTVAGRAFSLYVAVGSLADPPGAVARVNAAIAGLAVDRR